jgi:transposase InsO family protein
MLVKLHANAATTPKLRAYIQASDRSVAELADELGLSERTVRRWKGRKDQADRSSRPHKLATEFTLEEEEIAVELRTELGLSLDDALEVMQRCIRPTISRSALHRCLQRRGVSSKPKAPRPQAQPFAPTAFGYVHIDLKHLPRLQRRPAYVFVAIERTTRFVHVEIIEERSGLALAACLERFLKAFGYPVHTILTDNGSEFTDRFGDARWRQRDKGTGRHPFDLVCQAHAIKHKLTKPYSPQTNGMVERFNRRIADALRSQPKSADNTGKNTFSDPDQRNRFILTFISDYNRTRLRCLGYKAPAEALANLPGHNTKARIQAFFARGATRPLKRGNAAFRPAPSPWCAW